MHTTTYAKVCSLKYHAQVCNSVTQFLSIDLQALDFENKFIVAIFPTSAATIVPTTVAAIYPKSGIWDGVRIR